MGFDLEKDKFAGEVDLEAAALVRKGIVAPHEAIGIARESVLSKRRAKYNQSLELTEEGRGTSDKPERGKDPAP